MLKKNNFYLLCPESGVYYISSGCSDYVDYERDIFLLLWAREREKQYSFSRFFYAHILRCSLCDKVSASKKVSSRPGDCQLLCGVW